MVTLLLGPHGHGKSSYIIEKIKEDYQNKVRSYLIVPEQQTLISERDLTCALPPQAQLYTEATNLTRLADSVFRKTGGLKYNYINKSGQNLIMYRSLCETSGLLTQYKVQEGHEKACIKLFLQAVSELRTYGHTVAELDSKLEKIDNNNLKERLLDLLKIWRTYDEHLKKNYDDPYETLEKLAEKLGDGEFFANTNVYIDSFYGFTKSQLNVIERIIKGAKNVTIALDCPINADGDTIQYKKIVRTRDKIKSICYHLFHEKTVDIPFETDYKHANRDMRYVCKNLWDFSAKPINHRNKINLALAHDEFQECEFVSSRIKELIMGGAKYSEIAVIARNSATYQGIIDFTLNKYDIPYYMSASSKLMTKPVVKMIFSALSAINGYRQEDIIAYTKCGYTDIDDDYLYALESYMYRWGISGKKFKNNDYWSANPDGFVKTPNERQIETLGKIAVAREAVLKSLAILEEPFIKGATVAECTKALYNFLNHHNIVEKLNKEIKEETSQNAQELSQVWGVIVASLELIYDICGDLVCDIDTFISLLNYAMMDAKIGSIPSGEDRVTVADASLVRAKNIKHVFLLGANEGVFPAAVNNTSFFSDSDKIALETADIDLSSRTDEQGDDELLFFKNSISAASETATITSLKTSIKGGILAKSFGFTRLESLFLKYAPIDIDTLPIEDRLYTKKIAAELFGSCHGELRDAVRKTADPVEKSGDFVITYDSINPKTAEMIFGKQMHLSSSKLEKFAKCHFNYYCSEFLGLKDSSRIQFSYNDIGKLVHKIFEHFLILDKQDLDEVLSGRKKERHIYKSGEISDIITRLADDYTTQLCGVHGVSNKMKHYFDRLKSTVCVFVEALLAEQKASKFTPTYFELKIHGEKSPLQLELPVDADHTALISGYVDRVDLCRIVPKKEDGTPDMDASTTYVKILDYKTGSHEFKKGKLDKGLDMQMLIYLLALTQVKDSIFKEKLLGGTTNLEAGGITHLTYKIDKTDVPHEADFTDPMIVKAEKAAIQGKIKRSGIVLNNSALLPTDDSFGLTKPSHISKAEFDSIFDLVKEKIAELGCKMLSGAAYAEPLAGENPCNYCKNHAICRRKVIKWGK